MNMPCNSKIDCVDTENPFNNVSSEAPDAVVFLSRFYSNPQLAPALGANWTSTGCIGACQSTVSQADADACAEAQAIQCIADHNNVPPKNPVVDPPGTPTTDPVPIFGNTPQSCTTHCPDGFPFTYTVPAGIFTALNQAWADEMAHSYACSQVVTSRVCLGILRPTEVCADIPYGGLIVATGVLTYTFTIVSGALPPGLSLSAPGPRTAAITGTPTTPGTYSFTLQATDPRGSFMQKRYTISVVGITTASPLPDGKQGTAYSETLAVAGTLSTAPAWSVIAGTLPDGLILNPATGVIAGTPTASGTFNFTVLASDTVVGCTKLFQMTITSSCFDWSTLSWNAPTYFTDPGTTAFIEGIGASFDGLLTRVAQDQFHTCTAEITTAVFTYNGPGCNCNLHLVWSKNPNPDAPLTVEIFDQTALADILFTDQTNNPGNTLDIPFSFPNTGGVPHSFFVDINSGLGGNLPGDATNLTFNGTFSNV